MPNTMAAGVFMRCWFGRCSAVRTALITPFRSRSVCHESVLRRKFIHIGSMKMNVMKDPAPTFRARRISPRGYARRKQISVEIAARKMESPSAFRCSLRPMASTFAKVK